MENNKLKIFISYSHLDEKQIDEFIKHITPLKTNGLIDNWYDRKIIAGQDFLETIDNNLKNADIICLFISANFISSPACMNENTKALELKLKKGVSVVRIILSPCGWQDIKDISPLLALPVDGKAITSFTDHNEGWLNVYQGLKSVIEMEIKIKQLKLSDKFIKFLHNTELLSQAHSQKEEVLLDDIFIFPELNKYDELRKYEKKFSSMKLSEHFINCENILIAGEGQSGKTTLCKQLYKELREMNFVPIYVSDRNNRFYGRIENKILEAFKDQYEGIKFDDLDKNRIVPIIDDFHFAKNKEKHIQALTIYCHQIIVVDDIFSLNINDENLIKAYTHFKIEELTPSLRYELIKKWVHLTDKVNGSSCADIDIYQNIDKTTELVDSALGKIIGSGIMPAYPFFILSVISSYETLEKPLNQQITSQGYCYQVLIYLYLKKQGVKNDEVDTYINFLTEFAFYFFKEKKNELTSGDFNSFIKSHLEKFNLPIKQDIILKKLGNAQIIYHDSFNNYSFCYLYIYYYFVAKYLAENIEENTDTIKSILNNLQKDENAYIAIFISHHTKNIFILDEIIKIALSLFDKHKPATLMKEELVFFDAQVDIIVKASLPSSESTPEKERLGRLRTQDKIEHDQKHKKVNDTDENKPGAEFSKELRRCVKTVEVMGCIIKNRAGSLEKTKLEKIFKEAMDVHLRVLTSFFELIKGEDEQLGIIEYISSRLQKIIKEKEEGSQNPKNFNPLTQDQLEKLSRDIFWNKNFFVVCGFIDKIIHSLGSDKLTSVVEKVCEDENTPAAFLIKHGIFMWYNKNLQVENIIKRINGDGFSKTAKRIMNFQIVNHNLMHPVTSNDRQKLEQKLGIDSEYLLKEKYKNKQK
jgi:hypothetical protein